MEGKFHIPNMICLKDTDIGFTGPSKEFRINFRVHLIAISIFQGDRCKEYTGVPKQVY